jgi:ABC-type transport system involved in multi-copper enzyme maturation permease subunit
MIKLMQLEWKKLQQTTVIMEMIVYPLLLIFVTWFFIENVFPEHGQSYAAFIEFNLIVQMGLVLFGASLINHVFIEEYKNKTISLSFRYPFSRQKLFTAKILFIATFVFFLAIASYLFTGVAMYVIDQVQPMINGNPTRADIITFFSQMVLRSLIITLVSFIPLFLLGIWKRMTVPTVICAFVVMQSPILALMLDLNFNLILVVMCLIAGLSIFLSISKAESIGEI